MPYPRHDLTTATVIDMRMSIRLCVDPARVATASSSVDLRKSTGMARRRAGFGRVRTLSEPGGEETVGAAEPPVVAPSAVQPVAGSGRDAQRQLKSLARAPGILATISRACWATLCSHRTSYLVATVWVTEVKSRRPPEMA